MTVNAATSAYWGPLSNGVKKFGRHYANFVLGVEQNDKFSEVLRERVRGTKAPGSKKYSGGDGFNNFGKNVKYAWGESKQVVAGKSFWNVIKDSFKGLKGELKAAKGFKQVGKALWKRMPLIGNVAMIAFEIPNIYKAFTQGGLATGLGETLKAVGRLGVMTAGMALGAAVGGPIGGFAGAFAGDWLGRKIFGKTYTEKQDEAKAKEEEKNKVDSQSGATANVNQTQQDPNVAAQDATQVANNQQYLAQLDPSVLKYLSPEELAYIQSAYQLQAQGSTTQNTSFSGSTVQPTQTNLNQSLFAPQSSIFGSSQLQNQNQYPWMLQNNAMSFGY